MTEYENCSECGDKFIKLFPEHKICPKCYYAMNHEKNYKGKSKNKLHKLIKKDMKGKI